MAATDAQIPLTGARVVARVEYPDGPGHNLIARRSDLTDSVCRPPTQGNNEMLHRTVKYTILVIALSMVALSTTACQTTRSAKPEMLSGDGQTVHERHDSGVESHTSD